MGSEIKDLVTCVPWVVWANFPGADCFTWSWWTNFQDQHFCDRSTKLFD